MSYAHRILKFKVIPWVESRLVLSFINSQPNSVNSNKQAKSDFMQVRRGQPCSPFVSFYICFGFLFMDPSHCVALRRCLFGNFHKAVLNIKYYSLFTF